MEKNYCLYILNESILLCYILVTFIVAVAVSGVSFDTVQV